LVAADKTAGLTTQPPRRRAPGELTAHERVLLQLAARDGKRVEVMLFHRLDRLTTGVLVFARHRDAARALAKIWGSGAVQKQYLALVRGGPGKGPRRISGAIASDPLVHGRFRVARNGKPATTEVRLLARLAEFSLVEVRPLTGRTHQVRVHLAEAGFPIAGDALYGGAGGVPRPFLHSWRLTIPHPRTGRQLRLEAPVPADMQRFLAGLGGRRRRPSALNERAAHLRRRAGGPSLPSRARLATACGQLAQVIVTDNAQRRSPCSQAAAVRWLAGAEAVRTRGRS
jgi:23S rRNA pseudouridine1911/1915/1917 synthase